MSGRTNPCLNWGWIKQFCCFTVLFPYKAIKTGLFTDFYTEMGEKFVQFDKTRDKNFILKRGRIFNLRAVFSYLAILKRSGNTLLQDVSASAQSEQ